MKPLIGLCVLVSVLSLTAGCKNGNEAPAGRDQGRVLPAPKASDPNAAIEAIKNNPKMSPQAKEMAIRAAQQQMAAAQSRQAGMTIPPPGPPPKAKGEK